MDVYFFHPESYNKLYNCTFYDINSIPHEAKEHKLLGAVMIATYVMCMVLYVPCLLTMSLSSLRKRSSYQLMIFLGLNHLIGLTTGGLVTGVLMYTGSEFCRFPTIVYFTGMAGLCTWFGSTMTTFVLGVNRCCELYSSFTAEQLFGGAMRYFWLIILTIYAILPSIDTMPPIYDPIMMSWFYNPHHAYYDDLGKIYNNLFHVANNFIIWVAHTGVYVVFIGLYLKRVRGAGRKTLKDKSLYIQVISIGSIHFIVSILYIMQQFIPVTFYSSLLASAFYVLSQGIPPFIYLKYNKSLRKTMKETFCNGSVKISSIRTRKMTTVNTSSMASHELH